MTFILFMISCLLALAFFWIVRRAGEKFLEVLHFFSVYLLLLGAIAVALFLLLDPRYHYTERQFETVFTVMSLYIFPPTLVIAYLLYPFKKIKRSYILAGILAFIALAITGVSTLVEVLHAFSDM
ncbi:MAG: hypothetical protein LBF09_01135 [Odoribacteraceae bacterium]|jgi:hypothetical protein|nr:hypothetical protein [Odoribacteraceae bacterium]